MKIGMIGAGNMATALAIGIGEPILAFDPVAEKAEALASRTGGRACASNIEVATESDLVILCHKPAQLQDVAAQISGASDVPIASLLATATLEQLADAYGDRPLFRLLPNVAVEVRSGVIGWCEPPANPPELSAAVKQLFERTGLLMELPERLIDPLNAISGVGPAYVALIAEAQIDAGIRKGLPPAEASALAVATLVGTGKLLAARDNDTLALRRAVTSPGGLTARGLAALERGGLRAAFHDAADAVMSA